MPLRGPTIQDVARRAGVSATSVSNFLNGRLGEMSLQTRGRISGAIDELGYIPSAAARQLKTGHSSTLGLLLPTVANPYYGELAVAIDDAAQACGFRVTLCNTRRDPIREADFVGRLVADGVQGILIAAALIDRRVLESHVDRGTAFVLLEAPNSGSGIDHVDMAAMDNLQAGAMAVDHLVAHGYRDIAFATVTPMTPHRTERIAGYHAALERHGLGPGRVFTDSIVPRDIHRGDSSLADFGRTLASELLTTEPRPEAIITMNDAVGFGLLAGLADCRLAVPDDIAVISIDGTLLSRFSSPRLTTIRQPIEAIAEAALDCIRARLADRTRIARSVILAPSLSPGASVRRLR
jgi:DNA-binding LacI/PurR family transcriptional regulator